MTDEELQHIKRNGIMLKDAVYIVDKLIADVQQARKERDWLAEQMKSCIELHCPYRTTSIPSEPCYVGYASKKECWLKAAKEATK